MKLHTEDHFTNRWGFANDAARKGGRMSITSAQSYEMRIARTGDNIADPPEPYWQTVARL
jgi:hypothetical protein